MHHLQEEKNCDRQAGEKGMKCPSCTDGRLKLVKYTQPRGGRKATAVMECNECEHVERFY